jgi:hypothetical protein
LLSPKIPCTNGILTVYLCGWLILLYGCLANVIYRISVASCGVSSSNIYYQLPPVFLVYIRWYLNTNYMKINNNELKRSPKSAWFVLTLSKSVNKTINKIFL